MTPQQIKTLLDSGVLQAYTEGKEIQYRTLQEPRAWIDYTSENVIDFFQGWKVEWRVKPEKKTGWINIYSMTFEDAYGIIVYCYLTRELADDSASSTRIACIQISYEEGEGL